MKTYEEIEHYVKSKLSEKRFYHSKCVEERCRELAKIYNIDEEKAALVGIAHDIAKEMSHEEKLQYAIEKNIKIDNVERKSPELLHAAIGAKICQKEFEFTEDMIEAVASHTTGKAGMDMLSKILYISDAMSADRKYEDIEQLYELAKKDINAAILKSLNKTIELRLEKGKTIHLNTVEARNEYLAE